ncbi:glutathione S-transferase N-terminal domain-containing protein [Psychromonas sp. MME2]|uniref:glutathione S-transferase N-terminal domain-containing protein n=1 Tax=unclassified Psychromonas TaxID=2614957 RepID=UPI00339BB3B6
MFIIRWILGRIILLVNFSLPPKRRKREQHEQIKIDLESKSLQLYQYEACPFCVKVRRAMRRQNLTITTVDAKQSANKEILATQAGKVQVPCLRIEEANKVTWLYESKAIINYLNNRFA